MITPEPSTSEPESPEPNRADPAPLRPGRVWAFSLAAAVVAGLGAFALGEWVVPPFDPPVNMENFMGGLINKPTLVGLQVAERKNAMLTFGLIGGLLGLALGLAGGLSNRSARSALFGGAAGLALGAALGAGSAAGLVPIYHAQHQRNKDAVTKDLAIPLLIHVGLWSAVGLAAGAALTIGARAGGRAPSVVTSGLIGAALGAAVYEVVAALVSPEGRTYQPVSTSWLPRLLAATICPILTALLATFALVSPARPVKKQVRPASEAME